MRDWQTDGTLVNNEDITKFLPILHEAHMTLEHATRHAWDKTSYIRDSPNHSKAWALDVAPKIGLDLRPYYSYFKKSDPVLYKRVELLNRLKTIPASVFAAKLRNLLDNKNLSVGYFIEPDHIHIQLLKRKKQGEIGRASCRERV